MKRIDRVLAWGALAYFWSLINDRPVNADTLLGGRGYYFMEGVLNLLSLLCFVLAAREAVRGRAAPGVVRRVALWTALAFFWSAADDIPFLTARLRPPGAESWYLFEAAIHLVSLAFFYLVIREARMGAGTVESPGASNPPPA